MLVSVAYTGVTGARFDSGHVPGIEDSNASTGNTRLSIKQILAIVKLRDSLDI